MLRGVHLNQKIEVRRGDLLAHFEVKPGRGLSPNRIANLYNSAIDRHFEAGLAIQPGQIESRLSYDAEAVLVGYLDDEPAAFVNLVKLRLDADTAIPRTHQQLTDNETFAGTRSTDGNYWFCPWVGTEPKVRGLGWRAEIDLGRGPRLASLGQLMVLAVKTRALEDNYAKKLFVYSRPSRLRAELERITQQPFTFNISNGRLEVKDPVRKYFMNESGIYPAGQPADDLLLRIADHWAKIENKRRVEPVYQFHGGLGAQFRPDLVFPHGQVHDWNALGYRTLLEYLLQR